MLPQWIIETKRDGRSLGTDEIRAFIDGYARGSIPDYQMAALAMAIYFNGMTARETADLTTAMMETGRVLDPEQIPGIKVDKHSTGGIGDKISIVLAPLAAACGLTVPMISGRGLGITGGTLDKLESIPGYRVDLSETEFLDVLGHCGCSMTGPTDHIAPADKKLYALRDVTATVPSIPLIVSSILSKKLAEGIDALVLDVKCGAGAFMKTRDDARKLARALVETGTALGKKVVALITDMSQPLGRTVGNALEVQEALNILSGEGPADSRGLTIEFVRQMLHLATPNLRDEDGVTDPALHLNDGSALAVFERMVACHGGSLEAGLPSAEKQIPLPAPSAGYVSSVDAGAIGRASLLLGAGRKTTQDSIDPAVGLSYIRKIGEYVDKNEPLCIIHSNGHENAAALINLLQSAFKISAQQPQPKELIYEVVTY